MVHVVLLLFRVINDTGMFRFYLRFAASLHFSIFVITKDKYSVYFENTKKYTCI